MCIHKTELTQIWLKKGVIGILFRVSGGQDGNTNIGLGHVFRSINLAKYLLPNKIHFLVEDYGGAKKIIRGSGFSNVKALKKRINVKSDIKKTINYLKKYKIQLLIVDKYGIKLTYLKKLKKTVRVVLISDLRKIDYPADLIVNGFVGFRNKISFNQFGSKCLIGPSFQILDPRFTKKKEYKTKFKLLVTFGGSDEKNITEILCKQLIQSFPKIKTKIIIGPNTICPNRLNTLVKKSRGQITLMKETSDMYKEISSSEFGFCAGGITSYEFATLGKPFSIICVDKHQLQTAKEWERLGVARNLGLFNKKNTKRIYQFLNFVNSNRLYRSKRRNIVDGLGGQRVASEILKM